MLLLAGEEGGLCTGYLSDIFHAEHLDCAVPLGDLVGMELHGVKSQVAELAHDVDMADIELALNLSV